MTKRQWEIVQFAMLNVPTVKTAAERDDEDDHRPTPAEADAVIEALDPHGEFDAGQEGKPKRKYGFNVERSYSGFTVDDVKICGAIAIEADSRAEAIAIAFEGMDSQVIQATDRRITWDLSEQYRTRDLTYISGSFKLTDRGGLQQELNARLEYGGK